MGNAKYKTVYATRPDIDEEVKTALIECFDTILKDNGAEAIESKDWEKCRFTYEVNGYREGVYHVIKVSSPSSANTIDEFDRFVKINDDITRHVIVKEEAQLLFHAKQ